MINFKGHMVLMRRKLKIQNHFTSIIIMYKHIHVCGNVKGRWEYRNFFTIVYTMSVTISINLVEFIHSDCK